MKVIFNNQYEYSIDYARQSYDTAIGESFYITLKYSQELYEELLDFLNTTKINNIEIIKDNIQIYNTNIFTKFIRINSNFSNNNEISLVIEFVKRDDE